MSQCDVMRYLKFLLAVLFSITALSALPVWAQAEGDDLEESAPAVEQAPSSLSPAQREERLAAIRKQLSASRPPGDPGK